MNVNRDVFHKIYKLLKKYNMRLVYVKEPEEYMAAKTIERPYEDVPYVVVTGILITEDVMHFDEVMVAKRLERILTEQENPYVKMEFPAHTNWLILSE
jgi:hypothetical protein